MTHAQHVAKYVDQPYRRLCACGRPGTIKTSQPKEFECERCYRIEKALFGEEMHNTRRAAPRRV